MFKHFDGNSSSLRTRLSSDRGVTLLELLGGLMFVGFIAYVVCIWQIGPPQPASINSTPAVTANSTSQPLNAEPIIVEYQGQKLHCLLITPEKGADPVVSCDKPKKKPK